MHHKVVGITSVVFAYGYDTLICIISVFVIMARGMFYSFLMKCCKGCMNGKHHWESFPKDKEMRASQPLELIHREILGPTNSLGGA